MGLKTKAEPEGNLKPDGAKGMEGGGVAEGPEVCSAGRVITGQGGAGGMREPGGAMRMTVPGGAEGERCQEWSTG